MLGNSAHMGGYTGAQNLHISATEMQNYQDSMAF
jgi:hypothetical protein